MRPTPTPARMRSLYSFFKPVADGNALPLVTDTLTINGNGATLQQAGEWVRDLRFRERGGHPDDRGANVGVTVDRSSDLRPQGAGFDIGAYEFASSVTAPTAVDDTYSTPQDTPLTVATEGVLGNDIKGEGGSLTAALRSSPANGSVTLTEQGGFSYTPQPGFVGEDSFTYVAIDRGLSSNEATVRIRVSPGNQAAYTVFLPLIQK